MKTETNNNSKKIIHIIILIIILLFIFYLIASSINVYSNGIYTGIIQKHKVYGFDALKEYWFNTFITIAFLLTYTFIPLGIILCVIAFIKSKKNKKAIKE